jgi:hypothetical protein
VLVEPVEEALLCVETCPGVVLVERGDHPGAGDMEGGRGTGQEPPEYKLSHKEF